MNNFSKKKSEEFFLPQEGWNFSKVNSDELEYAHHWEFGRAREIWQGLTKQFRHKFHKVSQEIANKLTSDKFDDYYFSFRDDAQREFSSAALIRYVFEGCIKLPDVMLDIALFSPEWPDTPFMLIPEKERKRRRTHSRK